MQRSFFHTGYEELSLYTYGNDVLMQHDQKYLLSASKYYCARCICSKQGLAAVAFARIRLLVCKNGKYKYMILPTSLNN